MINNIFCFIAGAISGVTVLMVVVCCVAAGDYDRAEEEEMRRIHERSDKQTGCD